MTRSEIRYDWPPIGTPLCFLPYLKITLLGRYLLDNTLGFLSQALFLQKVFLILLLESVAYCGQLAARGWPVLCRL
jgi:hypothetical protein